MRIEFMNGDHVYTMDHEFGPWKRAFFNGPIRLPKKLVWGPSLGVNQLWTKKNDHAPKNECANVFDHMPKKDS